MLGSRGLIKQQMNQRGYSHRRPDDELTVGGEYARNLQYVYAKEHPTTRGLVVDLLYFSADMLSETLVIGLYRENVDVDNGVLENNARSLPLVKFSAETLDRELNKLLPPVRNLLKQ